MSHRMPRRAPHRYARINFFHALRRSVTAEPRCDWPNKYDLAATLHQYPECCQVWRTVRTATLAPACPQDSVLAQAPPHNPPPLAALTCTALSSACSLRSRQANM